VTIYTEASASIISVLHKRKPRWSHSLEKASEKTVSVFKEAVELTRMKSAAKFGVHHKGHRCWSWAGRLASLGYGGEFVIPLAKIRSIK
jgi:hypothetical protein